MAKRDTWILRPGLPGVKVPGETSLPPSEDERGDGASGWAPASPSPKKVRKGMEPPGLAAGHGDPGFDIGALKELLAHQFAEQATTLAAAQKEAIQEAVGALRRDFEGHREESQRQQRRADERSHRLETTVEGLVKRVEAIEQGKGAGTGTTMAQDAMAERHLFTLVFGGWPRETQRKLILGDLASTFQRLEVGSLLDDAPFTTGARRSMALATFRLRTAQGENFMGMRGRMQALVAALSTSQVYLGSDQHKLWVAFSRPKEARLNGNHAAWVRRAIRAVDEGQEAHLEAEYATGTCWLHGSKISSASERAPDGVEDKDLLVDETRPSRPWIATKLVAQVMNKSEQRVREALDDQKR